MNNIIKIKIKKLRGLLIYEPIDSKRPIIINTEDERRPPIIEDTKDNIIAMIIINCHLILNLFITKQKAIIGDTNLEDKEKRPIIKESKPDIPIMAPLVCIIAGKLKNKNIASRKI